MDVARRAAAGRVGEVRIGYNDFAIAGPLGTVLQAWRHRAPDVEVRLERAATDAQLARLEQGRLDIAFVVAPVRPRGFEQRIVRRDRLVAVLPDTHPLAAREHLAIGELAAEPHVFGDAARWRAYRRLVQPLYAPSGGFPDVVAEGPDSSAVLGLVAAGIGVTIYPECIADVARRGIAVRALLDVDATVDTAMVWSGARHRSRSRSLRRVRRRALRRPRRHREHDPVTDTVLVLKPLRAEGLALLNARADIDVVRLDEPSPGSLAERVPEADAICIKNTPFPAALLDRAPRLRVIAKHGVGLDNLPMAALGERGIPVLTVGEANATSVAEHTLMLMLGLARRVVHHDARVRAGGYIDDPAWPTRELAGATLLLIGLGRIGARVANLAHAFDLDVVAFDPYATAAGTGGGRRATRARSGRGARSRRRRLPALPADGGHPSPDGRGPPGADEARRVPDQHRARRAGRRARAARGAAGRPRRTERARGRRPRRLRARAARG